VKPIPITAAKRIADEYGYDQVIVFARKVGEDNGMDGGEHLTTYGINRIHCKVAAHIGEFLKREIFRWTSTN
jgi:hypothetical protein